MISLSLIGLKHGLLIGLVVGLISFVPYLGSLTGLVVSTCVAIAQFWPNWLHILIVPALFFVGQSLSAAAGLHAQPSRPHVARTAAMLAFPNSIMSALSAF
jgi:hypothetical protein